MDTVLLIDESDGWSNAVAATLAEAGFSVLRETEPERALERAMDERPVAVMLDLLTAVKGGPGYARRLRSLPSLRNTPLLATTTGVNSHVARQVLGSEVDDVLIRDPQTLDGLSLRIRQLTPSPQ